MRILPITHNFTRVNASSPSFGKYESPEAESLGEEMMGKVEYPPTRANTYKLPGALRDTEMVTIRKDERGALWCEVNRPYFEEQSKRLRDLDERLDFAASQIYPDFINSIENPMDKREQAHPVKVAGEGLYGPIFNPRVLSRIAWEVFSNDPKDLCRNGIPPEDTSSSYERPEEKENYAATRGWW